MKRRLIQAGVLMLIAALVCSIVLAEKCRDKKVSLPAEVLKSLTESYPDASIEEVKKDEEEFKVYEVELLLKDGREVELTLTPDGKIMEIESEVEAAALPFDVATIVPKGGKLKEVESEVTYMVLVPVALEQPKTTYSLEVMVDGQEMEIEVTADGKVISIEKEDDDDDEDDEADDDEDDDEDETEIEVSIDQVPAAVKATILSEAQGADIKEIELESKNGKMIYEAEFMADGQEVEIKIAPDGTLLGREIEDEDEDDDD